MIDKIENILKKIVDATEEINGIDAVVLGGSHATGTANKDSDIDIGIYYDKNLFDISKLKVKMTELNDEKLSNLLTDLYEWGP